jgi:hypothetical protein
MRKGSKLYLFILIITLITAIIIASFVAQFNQPQIPYPNNKSTIKPIATEPKVVYVEMPDGENLIAEVQYEGNWIELVLKFQDGKTIGSERWTDNELSDSEIRERAIDLIHFLKKESRHSAMSRIIFYGMQKGVPNNESTKAANAFGEYLDTGKNPDECVQKLKGEYVWVTKINFSDLILLYKGW